MGRLSRQSSVSVLKVRRSAYERSRGVLGHRLLIMSTFLLRTTGHRRPPAWLLNPEARPEVEVQVGTRRMPATATSVRPGDPDYGRLFAIGNKAKRGQFAAYRKRTDRPLSVVVLTPVG